MATRVINLAQVHDDSPDLHSKLAMIAVSDGSDELETLILYDVLKRANIRVILAACSTKDGKIVHTSHGMKLVTTSPVEDSVDYNIDLIALPGGETLDGLRDCEVLIKLLKKQVEKGKWIAALSNAPAEILMPHLLLDGKATCHPSKARDMTGYFVDQDFAVTKTCITSQGQGTAMRCALKLVEILCGHEAAKRVANEILFTL
ncbi:unnamed protein product [Albugo candida]|uniref:DJ-1/PfpI domain-containing protein n=2 Tax=Albugo candida TaxID=65357 RepID=A0A024GRD9_9STRA|nr:unnamed protein product [Albugo candida]|eukprot:CCI49354.1 unnamed protein product [Albugo candida]